jgi:ATP-binding cassette subfamily A (ABC1) protein 3
MALVKQIWTLMSKNFKYLLARHLLLCVLMAFVLPILFASFLSFSRNLFVPPANYGIGEQQPVKSLPDAFGHASGSGRNKVVLVNGGHTGGDIERLFDRLEDQLNDIKDVIVTRRDKEEDIVQECRSSLRGVTTCFNAVVMRSSPNEGRGNLWNYTIRTDGAFVRGPLTIDVESANNPEQVYFLPMQRAIDTLIGGLEDSGSDRSLSDSEEFPFTSLTQDEREARVRERFSKALVSFMGVAFIASILWITYHLTGFVATERETGMSQLLDAMMPVRQQWMAQAARIIAHHLSFSLIYLPGWIIASLIIRQGVFPTASIGIILIFHIISGLAIASMSLMIASLFQKAQLSGITAILGILLLGILAQSITSPGTGVVAVLSVLFTPCSYVYFTTLVARFEERRMAASLTETAPGSPWSIPGIVFWIFLIIQIFAYPLIGAFIERRFYGASSAGRRVLVNEDEKMSLGHNAVQLQGFTKIYTPNFFSRLFSGFSKQKEPVIAAKELSFSVTKGQIVALLGANGSGKSTTLDSIAGLNKLTHGSITIDGTGGIGIAPQKNVLWDDLTVREHITIFNRLKSPKAPATKAEIDELIRAIDLWPKRKSFAKTLSGGQKRKLQLGMMLTGGSAVCCVDEVSSGIDPLSRRKLWDILLAERGKRTLILTTHFLDEADLLADDIVILSKGTLRAQGSSVQLKDSLGGGYRVHVHKHPGLTHTPDVEGVKKDNAFDLVTYAAPSSQLAALVIKQLEAAGITDYRFSGPTIEDVFLHLAEEIRDEEAFQTTTQVQEIPEKRASDEYGTPKQLPSHGGGGLELMDGQHVGYVKQARILFMKRFTVLKRNWIPYLIAFLLPIVAAGLTSLYIKNSKPSGCSPADQSSMSGTEDAFSQVDRDESIIFLAGPRDRFAADTVARLFRPIFQGSSGGSSLGMDALGKLEVVDSFDSFRSFITENRKNVTTAIWLGDRTQPATVGWVANKFLTSSITAQQFLDVMLTNTSIATTWSPFDIPLNPSTGDALNLVVYMGIALACYPGFFALYPSNERRRFVRGLQYSNGVRPLPLWLAYLLFDFSIALVAAAIVTAIWAGISDVWYHLEFVFIILFLYGIAATLFAYVVSLFTKTQLSTFAWAASGQALLFLAYLIAYMCVQTYAEADKIDDLLKLCHWVISALAPIGSVTRALFVTLNLFSTACDGDEVSSSPERMLGYGGPIIYLVIQSFVLFGLLLWFDSGSVGSSWHGLFQGRNASVQSSPSDEEVAHELERVTSSGTRDDGLRVTHLTKSFGKNTAVDNVSFGVKHGEVFALLGPNGAGKSTTISMIRGDLKPSRNGGDIFVEDVSVTKNLAAARANLGVCPQVDALDQMTVREHLEFYAKVRGIPDVEHNVAQILHAVGLSSFSSRMAHALSGGNKRKLSLGIALMGNPTVVLLDEPSSGLDAASKRIMWKTLAATIPGRSILLTTHSMEEADALAGRAGILARRMLALGTPDDLRHRFGDALHIHLVSSTAPRTSEEEMQRVIDWIRTSFPSADVEKKTYHGQIRFSVRASEVLAASRGESADIIREGHNISQSAIGHLVVMLEERREELGIGHYSVSPTGLDQVFLTIVGQHNVREENYEEKKETWWAKMWSWGRA